MKIYKETERELNRKANDKKTALRLAIAAGALLLFFVAVRLLSLSLALSEFMARTVNRFYNTAVGQINSLFSVSLYETFIYITAAVIICLVVRAVWRLRRQETVRAISCLLVIIIIALSIAGVYNFTAGFAYNRAEMPMQQSESRMVLTDVRAFAEDYLGELTALSGKMEYDPDTGHVICPYSFGKLNSILQNEYARLGGDYFTPFTPAVKKIASGWAMSNMHLTGIAFSPFGEANVNSWTPARSLPVVMAHEMAHIKGVMREDDANLLAYYICLTAKDDYVRYCAYSYTLFNVLNATYSRYDNYYSGIYSRIPEKVQAERAAISAFWAEHNLLGDIANWFNDIYLKFNGTGGTSDYADPGSSTDEKKDVPPEEITVTLSRVQRMIFSL